MSTTTARSYAQVIADARADTRELVRVERDGARAVVTLDDPARLNVLSAALTVQLHDALAALVADPGVRAVVLTGAGRAFSAGGDLRLMREATQRIGAPGDEEGASMPYFFIRRQFGSVVRLLAGSDTAFVAALEGPAAGVGLAFALACDVLVASDTAVLVPAFGRLGLVPEVGTSWMLTRRLGYHGAFAFYVSGEHVTARRAHELGLVTEVVAPGELDAAARGWAQRIADLPPHAVPLAKPLLRQAADAPWPQALALEEAAEPMCFTTAPFAAAVEELLGPQRG